MAKQKGSRDPVTNLSPSRTADTPVVRTVYIALQELEFALRDEYGADFAYTIMGNGHLVAASNYRDGVITPVRK